MFIREIKKGEWYVCRQTSGKRWGKKRRERIYRDWYLVKWGSNVGVVCATSICFPKEFIGKKIRLKIEIMEDKKMEETKQEEKPKEEEKEEKKEEESKEE